MPTATKGSQRHIQHYVNDPQRVLDAAIFGACPGLARRATGPLDWVSPLSTDAFNEYRDEAFLAKLGVKDGAKALEGFWPRRGATWDALARVPLAGNKSGALLIEAKAHRAELKAKDETQASSAVSIQRISDSMMAARTFFGVDPEQPAWHESYYQVCNRLAHLYFMNEVLRVETWLAWVFIAGDVEFPDALQPWQWARAFSEMLSAVGLPPGHPLADRVFAVYVPARPAERRGIPM